MSYTMRMDSLVDEFFEPCKVHPRYKAIRKPQVRKHYEGCTCDAIYEQAQMLRRLEAAEEVCSTLILMMQLGGIDGTGDTEEERKAWREMLAEPMQKWSDLAFKTGLYL